LQTGEPHSASIAGLADLADHSSPEVTAMTRSKRREPGYDVELLLGLNKTGMLLPKNTGNWFSFRIFDEGEEIGTVTAGCGSIRWRPHGHKKFMTRGWRQFAQRMEASLR
jgi:hypothetical protein